MDVKNFTGLLLTTAGIFIGWILTQFSSWYKGRKEDNRIRKQVLFNLLEIYYLIERINHGSVKKIEVLSEKLIELLPIDENTPENKRAIKELIIPFYKPFVKQIFSEELDEIDKSYKIAVQSLAPVDPLIAYYLNGKTSAFRYIEKLIDKLLSQAANSGSSQADITNIEQSVSDILHNKIYETSIGEIKALTVDVASNIGLVTKLRVKKLLAKPFSNTEDDEKEINDFVLV